MKRKPSAHAILTYVAVVVSIVAIGTVISVTARSKDNKDRIEDIEKVQREACDGRNVLRHIQRDSIQREVDQSVAFEASGSYAKFFPNIPAPELHKLLEDQRDSQREDIKKLAPEDCNATS